MSPIEDGYDGHWEPRRKAEGGDDEPRKIEVPVGQWPMELPETKRTTLAVSKDGDAWVWRCTTCDCRMVTDTMSRPDHVCET